MKILVVGKTGQLAQELARAEWPEGWSASFAGRDEVDLSEPGKAAAVMRDGKASLVINAAAYTAVDKAESEPDLAMRINAEGPAALGAACAELHVPFVTVSTDYVFDGTKQTAYTEQDAMDPLGAYGRSKAEGERRVREAHGWHLIVRTSWVFSPFGSNFVKTMLRLARERDSIGVVRDQRGRPTAAGDLAKAIVQASQTLLERPEVAGTYHVANAGPVSWFEFAQAVFEEAGELGARTPKLRPIGAAEFPTAASRPANSELATTKFESVFGFSLRHWREPLREVLDELLPASAASPA